MRTFNLNCRVLITLLILTGCTPLATHPDQLDIKGFYQEGADAYGLGNYQQAKSKWQQGLALASTHRQQRVWGAEIQIGLAQIHENTGDYIKAIDLAKQALTAAQDSKLKATEARAHAILGLAYRRIADYANAKMHSIKASEIAHQIKNPAISSESVRNLASILQLRGHYEQAQSLNKQALAFAEQSGDQLLQAKALNNIGGVYRRLAQYPDALKYYQQSLKLRTTLNDRLGQGKVIGNICLVHQQLNDYEKALKFCQDALNIARTYDDKGREANHLNNMGGIYRDWRKYKKAKEYYQKSVSIKRTLLDYSGVAKGLNNIADILRLEGHYQQALKVFTESLAIKIKLEDKSGQSATHYNIGLTYAELGDYKQALNDLNKALVLQKELQEPELLWRIYGDISHTHQLLNHQRLAIFFGKHAVNSIQSSRSAIKTLTENQQKSFLKNKRVIFEQLANQLIDASRLLEAQQVLDMIKEDEYSDFISRSSDSDNNNDTLTSFSIKESEIEKRYLEISSTLIELGLNYESLKKTAKSPEDKQRLEKLQQELVNAREALDNYLIEMEQQFANDQRAPNFTNKELDKLQQYQGILNDFEDYIVLIHYLMTDEKLRILVTGPNKSIPPVLRESLVSRSELNKLIHEFRTKLIKRLPIGEEASQLYDILIDPIVGDLELFRPDILMIYPDLALRYLPFSALHDSEQYLSEVYAINMYNAAASTHMLVIEPETYWNVAAFGVSESGDSQFKDLPAVNDEIDAIVKEAPNANGLIDEKGILPGKSYINNDFTPEQLADSLQQKNNHVIHLATHFSFSPGSDSRKNSFLLAGNSTRLNLKDLQYGDFDFDGKDLITLSACETGLGELDMDGREVEGLGAFLQRQGTHAVLATLWSVEDCSTAQFMEKFYQRRESEQLTKTEALRQTQLEFIRSDLTSSRLCSDRGVSLPPGESKDLDISHPFFWAPFILMGNWL